MKRRAFLQRAGLALAALGASQAGLYWAIDRYQTALAQTSDRKLALLVGINQYPQLPALTGCITDVELQQELLIYRFGFQPQDILVLTDAQATRQNIEAAFVDHLIGQAKSGDAVIFHFSGYGSRLIQTSESPALGKAATQNCLVPVDALSAKSTSNVNVLLEETLWLLWQTLATDRVTTILDTSYFDPSLTGLSLPLWGNLRMRSRPAFPADQLSPEELAFQAELASELKTNPIQKLLGTNKPGQLLAAADANHVATELQWNRFSAGLFTYALTQHLWQVTEPTTIQVSFGKIYSKIEQIAGHQQQPDLTFPRGEQQIQTYHLLPVVNTGAEGAVIGLEESGKTGVLWLAGLPATVLDSNLINSILTLVASPQILHLEAVAHQPRSQVQPGNEIREVLPPDVQDLSSPDEEAQEKLPLLQIRSREGLKAKAKLVAADSYNLKIGQLVQEYIRVLPRNIGLTVALDTSLERIERVDATSAFANMAQISSVVAGEQAADCLFGRVEKKETATGENTSSLTISKTQYGLFTLGKELIGNTLGEPGEAIKTAVYRLTPKLQNQLAAKLLRLSGNEGSSRLGVKAVLEMVGQGERMLMQKVTHRASGTKIDNRSFVGEIEDTKLVSISNGSQIQYRLYNYGDRPIYFTLLGTDSGGNAIALYAEKDIVILPGESAIAPSATNPFKWIVSGPSGFAEIHLIFSHAPFSQTVATLDTVSPAKAEGGRVAQLSNPLEVAKAVLQDLHQASAVSTEILGISPDTWALDVNAWATLTFVYEVVGNV